MSHSTTTISALIVFCIQWSQESDLIASIPTCVWQNTYYSRIFTKTLLLSFQVASTVLYL